MSPLRRATATPLTEAAPVFAALGDATRLKLVARLCPTRPQSIASLSEDAGVSRQAVTKHLHALGRAELVRDDWRGRDRHFELEPRRAATPRARAGPPARARTPLRAGAAPAGARPPLPRSHRRRTGRRTASSPGLRR